jgi:myo-inositol-1(or 4)-monophosphatase
MMNVTADPVLAVAVRAARRAASVIIDASRDLRRLPTFSNEHGEIAAAAESDAQNALAATISAAFPEHAILSGDSGEIKQGGPQSPHRWIVDAIDGRLNFVHGFPYFAVSVALANGDDLTHAVILDPAHDELFTAIKDKGAQRNGASMRVSACTRLSDALIGTVFPTRKSGKLDDYLPVFNALVENSAGVLRAGACALDLAHLASGRLDGFWVTSLRAFDVAAGALLVSEAGGRVGDFAGGSEYLRTNEVIAAAPGLFNPLREAIAAALPA